MKIEPRRRLVQCALDHVERCRRLEIEIANVDGACDRRHMGIDDGTAARSSQLPALWRGGDNEIGREQQIGTAGGDALRGEVFTAARASRTWLPPRRRPFARGR